MKVSVKIILDDCIDVEADTIEQAHELAKEEFFKRYIKDDKKESLWWIEAHTHHVDGSDDESENGYYWD